MRKPSTSHRLGIKFGPANLGNVSKIALSGHRKSTQRHAPTGIVRDRASAAYVDYITHAELLRLALRNHCRGIHAEPALQLCCP